MKLLYTFFLFFTSNYLFSQQANASKASIENELVQISKIVQVSNVQQQQIKDLLQKKNDFLVKGIRNKDKNTIETFQNKLFLDVLEVLQLNGSHLSSDEQLKLKEVLHFK